MKGLTIFVALFISLLAEGQNLREINIDFEGEKGQYNKFFNECIGAGRANEGLRADWQEQLKQVKQDCGFRYIRFHGLFHDDMGVYFEDEEGNPIYNWQYIDKLYDFLVSIDMKPFVELSFMPTALASGTETVFWWKGNITPPKSYEKYYEFIKAFTKHLTDRYGSDEVKTWYFEVWNEPNLSFFWTGGEDAYYKLYKTATQAVKSISEDYRLGGPATAGAGWIKEFLAYCKKDKVSCDFIATHAYNVSGYLDEFGQNKLKMLENPDDVVNQVKNAYGDIQTSSFKDAKLHFTEWSSSYSPLDPIHDTYQNATFVLNTLKKVEGVANSMSYWVFTDIFEEAGVPKTPFHGGFGLMNLQGIKKPTYFLYEYLNQLGDIELTNDDANSWACKDQNDVQLLLWDFTYSKQGNESNQSFYRKDIPSKVKGEVKVQFSNMKNGLYSLEVYKTGYRNNDVFTAYHDMGLPSQLTIEMVNHLKLESSNFPIIKHVVKIEKGIWNDAFKLNENDIYFIKISKI